jgi:hypothetical protein
LTPNRLCFFSFTILVVLTIHPVESHILFPQVCSKNDSFWYYVVQQCPHSNLQDGIRQGFFFDFVMPTWGANCEIKIVEAHL